MRTKMIAWVAGAACTLGANAATFTGELYGFWEDDDEFYNDEDCGIVRLEEGYKDYPVWRTDYVEVDGVKEPASFGCDGFAFPVTISPGETFSAEIIHGSSTSAHIKSARVLSDDEMFDRFSRSDEWDEYEDDSHPYSAYKAMTRLWPSGATKPTRAWIFVEHNNVTNGPTYSIDLAKWPIVNGNPSHPYCLRDLSTTKFYNPADGDGGLSSTWTIASFAEAFGARLSGVRKVTESVWYKVGIKGGDVFPQRVWNVCTPFSAKDYSGALETIDDEAGDDELVNVPGLFFITHDMVSGGSSGDAAEIPSEWQKAAQVSITVTNVGIWEGGNALCPSYRISGPTNNCHALEVTMRDPGKTRVYGTWRVLAINPDRYYPDWYSTRSVEHEIEVCLDGTGLRAGDLEDGEPPVPSVILDFALLAKDNSVLATTEVRYPECQGFDNEFNDGFRKAKTFTQIVLEDDGISVLTIKTSKIDKKGFVTVGGSILDKNGKTLTIKSAKMEAFRDGGDLILSGELKVSDGSILYVDELCDCDETEFEWKGIETFGETVGGPFHEGETMFFNLEIDDMPDLDEGWEILEDALPYEVELQVAKGGKKWILPKAPSIKYTQFSENGVKRYELTGLEDEKKTNYSNLKLTYTPKTGMFKGSFCIYATDQCCIDGSRKPKLKKFTVKASGVVVDGVGYGKATCDKLGVSWRFTIE